MGAAARDALPPAPLIFEHAFGAAATPAPPPKGAWLSSQRLRWRAPASDHVLGEDLVGPRGSQRVPHRQLLPP
eukprot:10327335-Alexandrium_andersonii.AAC.2